MIYHPYSISKLGTYTQCPLKFKFKYIDKIRVPFTMNVALYKGSYIHKIIEEDFNYDTEFKTTSVFTPEEKAKAEAIVRNFEASELGQFYKGIVANPNIPHQHEGKFAIKIVDSKLVLCGYGDKDAWIRGALDLEYEEPKTVYNVDWKSGKNKSQDKEFGIDQSMAYSIYLMLKYPHIDTFVSKFVFVEHNDEKEIIYYRSKLNEYIKHFYDQTKKVETDNHYDAEVTALCGWCDFSNHGYCTKPEEKENMLKKLMDKPISFDF